MQIANTFNVSCETARRDLEYLQKRNLLRRIHGGAVLIDNPHPAPIMMLDLDSTSVLQDKLAQRASEHIFENDVVFIGQGTTTGCLARCLKTRHNITILTNSIFVINELLDSNLKLYALGGLIDHNECNMSGNMAIEALKNIYANKAFISCGGATISDGVSDYTGDGTLLRMMLEHAETRYLIATSNKFGRNAFGKICDFSEFNTVISDVGLAQEYQEALQRMNITCELIDVS